MKAFYTLFACIVLLLCFETGIVFAQEKSNADITTANVELPEILVQSMDLYKSLKGYRDTCTIETHMVSPIMDTRITMPGFFAFERPKRFRYESTTESIMGGETKLFCNGEKIISYMGMWKQYTEEDVPEMLTSDNLQMIQGVVARNIIMSDDPLKNLKQYISEIKEVGNEKLDGISTSIIEFLQTANSIGTDLVQGKDGEEMLIPVRMWIGRKDFLIRKMTYELDMDHIINSLPEEQRSQMRGVYKEMKIILTEIHKDIELDPVFTDKDFEFVPPGGAKLVDNYTPPGRSDESKTIRKQ